MNTTAYDVITARIVSLLEAGTVPWHKPWGGAAGFPRNLISGKQYRGVNVWLLHAMRFDSPYWLTFKQAKELGGSVRAGEHSCPVVFWKRLAVASKDADGDTETASDGKPRIVPMLRYFNVFNVAQCSLPPGAIKEILPPPRENRPIEEAEAVVAGMPHPPTITQTPGRGAFYLPALDTVNVPPLSAFESPEAYYSTLFHELTHSTGHESRLNRRATAAKGEHGRFGSPDYAREELVAEMGAAFLCGHVGIVDNTVDNSAAYIAGWLERLRNDNRLVVTAAAQAQKSSDYILGTQFGSDSEEHTN